VNHKNMWYYLRLNDLGRDASSRGRSPVHGPKSAFTRQCSFNVDTMAFAKQSGLVFLITDRIYTRRLLHSNNDGKML
jgi:hypothetical protein